MSIYIFDKFLKTFFYLFVFDNSIDIRMVPYYSWEYKDYNMLLNPRL